MKKLILILTLIALFSSTIWADTISVMIDGSKVELSDLTGYPFVDSNGRTAVPFRATLESFGADVTWLTDEKAAVAKKDGITVKVPLGRNIIIKNGQEQTIDTAAVNANGRVYLPIRAVMEAFGCQVSWDTDMKAVIIKSSQKATTIDSKGVEGDYRTTRKYDLRQSGKITEVKNQGRTSACWVFTDMDQLECMLRPAQTLDLSEDHVIHNSDYHITYQTGGYDEIVMSYLASWKGPVLEKDDPFNDHKTNTDAKPVGHVQDIYYRDMNVDQIKEAIFTYGPVKTDIYLDQRVNVSLNEDTAGYYYTGDDSVNHSVIIVGWDDDFPKESFTETPPKDGAYIVKNSWGGGYGKLGYFYVSYYDKTIGKSTLIIPKVEPVNNYAHIYQHETTYPVVSYGYDSEEGWGANVFRKNSLNESLAAVSLYTLADNTEYVVAYVDNFDTVLSFENLEIIKEGTIKYQGYHTIRLDHEIPLPEGEKFAVAILIKTPGFNFPIPVEEKSEDTPNAKAGYLESYASGNGYDWEDVGMTDNANVSIKAFTVTN